MLRHLRYLGGTSARVRLRRVAARFLALASECRQTQRQSLERLLALNADSRFSREHGLQSVRTPADYRRQLPVCDFETFEPYVEKVKLGDQQALLGSQNRLLMFSLSSGTTRASKYIPITEPFVESYRRGWHCWGIRTFDDHPAINVKNIVQLSSDYDQFRTASGTPCGNISGLVMAIQGPFVQLMYTVPPIVSKISDPDTKYYATLRFALADRHVGMATTANPSTLIHLARLADARKEDLIRDIADGTLTSQPADENELIRTLRRKVRRPRRARARELEHIVHETGRLYPRDYWPAMEVVAVWTGGSAAAYLDNLRQYYGDVPIRDHGLSASEGRMTIPIEDDCPAGILDISSHFFEFIPEGEHERPNPTVLEAHELLEGENYFILLTTASGLYRYNICDVVRCAGFYGTTPLLEFLHKGAHISNITGEKVSESQVVAAVCRSAQRLKLQLDYFTVAPAWGEPPGYQLIIEEGDLHSSSLGEALAKSVDGRLCHLNREYREKRTSGRLAPLKWVGLPPGTWQSLIRQKQARLGGSLEQYKHPCLIPDLSFSENLLRQFAARESGSPQVDRESMPVHNHLVSGLPAEAAQLSSVPAQHPAD